MSAVGEVLEEVRITNTYGLHARPAAQFVKLANRFQAEIWVRKQELEVNGKSIMGMMMLAAECGSAILIRAVGDDATQAVRELVELVANKFNEE
ncbi:MAG: HPr family phosphocarrier protein [Longimicrobiales bacterium]